LQSILLDKFTSRSAIIGVIGLGYVGLPLVLRFCQAGFKVVGFDIDHAKVDQMNAGMSPIEHISDVEIREAISAGFVATGDFARATEADALILCVPTPLSKHREPDLGFVLGTIESLSPHLRPGQIVSLESTTYPGTTDEEIAPRMSARGLTIGRDAFLVYSPEREDPGNPDFTTRTIPKICGGHTRACLDVGVALYSSIIDRVVPVSSTRAAELTKLLENIHRAVNIGLVNEMKLVADRMGLDIREVIDAAATKPFGFVPYYPGPGLGGHCIPIDPFYLTWKAREYGVNTRFIELAGEVNSSIPDFVVSKVVGALNRKKLPAMGSKVLVLGIAYKPNVDDMRESPSVIIMEKLRDIGAIVHYSDPHIPKFPKTRGHRFDLESVDLDPISLSSYDCVVLATDHNRFDYALIEIHARLIVDTRGRFRNSGEKVVAA
jgi:UDP-N-acetyl-D-glucosamine dehydrogenase